MNLPISPIGRIRDVAAKIKVLEDRLMGNKIIPMPEQTAMHTEIRSLKKELEDLERRTRR